jgi:formylglycine-generating enzyme required for sulfatase activity
VAWLAEATGKPYRLPSEAEWEYAARAGTATRYAFGDEITGKKANFGGAVGTTTEVGAYPANAWGLHDMHGNVWEWVEDIWHGSYRGAPTDDAAWTNGEGKNSPRGRVIRDGSWGNGRVIRGGSWGNSPRIPRAANRNWYAPDIRSNVLGFRVARTLD